MDSKRIRRLSSSSLFNREDYITSYQYDAYGNRVKKQTFSEKVSYEYAGGGCQREIHRNFWTSYIDKKDNMNLSFGERKSSRFQDNDILTIYDFADIMKSIGFQESDLGNDEGSKKLNEYGLSGIMQSKNFGGREANNSFFGIGSGIIHFSKKLKIAKSSEHNNNMSSTTTIKDMKTAIGLYYGWIADGTKPPMWYITQVWANFNRMRNKVGLKRYCAPKFNEKGEEIVPGEIVTEYQN